jgi:hypothetical protein
MEMFTQAPPQQTSAGPRPHDVPSAAGGYWQASSTQVPSRWQGPSLGHSGPVHAPLSSQVEVAVQALSSTHVVPAATKS